MGQTESIDCSPLTFGYVSNQSTADSDVDELDMKHQDFVLNNPQLYQLQAICQQCSPALSKSGVTVSSTNESCTVCKKRKRLSLIRKDLADDLNYIDQTYYPDLVHYNTNTSSPADPMEDELLQIEQETKTEEDDGHFSRLTIGDVSPNLNPRRLVNPVMSVDLSNRSIVKLSPSIGHLQNLSKLELSNNQMTELPRELGYLKNLVVLKVSNNKLEEIPDTIAFLTKLKAFNVSHNNLKSLPPALGGLSKLIIIVANNNQLESIPRELAKLKRLASLNVSHNPLTLIPAEIAALQNLRKLMTDGCEFKEEYSYELKHDPPTLFEICSRSIMRSRSDVPQDLTDHIKDYLATAERCSYCKGYFFENYVRRIRFIERTSRQTIVIEYKLCSAHWVDEDDRLRLMFSEEVLPTPSVRVDVDGIIQPARRNRSYSDTRTPSPVRTRMQRSLTNAEPPTTIPLYRLKSQPTLPVLMLDEPTQTKSLPSSPLIPNAQRNRPRSSSNSSITKRFTNFLSRSSSPNLLPQGESGPSSPLKVPNE